MQKLYYTHICQHLSVKSSAGVKRKSHGAASAGGEIVFGYFLSNKKIFYQLQMAALRIIFCQVLKIYPAEELT